MGKTGQILMYLASIEVVKVNDKKTRLTFRIELAHFTSILPLYTPSPKEVSMPAITCPMLTIETLEQDLKYQS